MMDENNLTHREQEGREVVSWYVPPEKGEEVVRYYVQPRPLPESVRPRAEAAPMKKKKKVNTFVKNVMSELVPVASMSEKATNKKTLKPASITEN